MPDRPDLSIVIVSWNGRDDVLRCLEAVQASATAAPITVETVLVDNASEDGTVAAVLDRFAGVTVISNERNVGFPRANNQGVGATTGRHVLLLNPDTEVGSGTLEACVGTLDGDPTIGAVGCRLLYPDGRTQYEGGRRAYRLRHLLWEALYLHVLFPRSALFAHQLMGDWDHTGVRDVEAISGAFFMIRRDLLERVGGVPERLFMYHEDLSLCLKVRAEGFRVRYRGDVWTVHHHGMSARRSNLALDLLEGPVRVELIRERSGRLAGWTARVLFGLRGVARGVLAVVGRVLPGLGRVKRERPRAFQPGVHFAQALWAAAPAAVRGRMPRAADSSPDSPPGLARRPEPGDG